MTLATRWWLAVALATVVLAEDSSTAKEKVRCAALPLHISECKTLLDLFASGHFSLFFFSLFRRHFFSVLLLVEHPHPQDIFHVDIFSLNVFHWTCSLGHFPRGRCSSNSSSTDSPWTLSGGENKPPFTTVVDALSVKIPSTHGSLDPPRRL